MATPSEAEKAATLKAIEALAAYRNRITALLKRERPADWNELLHPREFKGSFHNVAVTYFDFAVWLYRFDDKLTRGLPVNINSYRYQRHRHMEDVEGLLVDFLGTDTGKALKHAFHDAGNELKIYPFFNFKLYNVLPFRALGLNSTAQAGLPKPGIKGTDAIVMFTPHLWNRNGQPGSFGLSGPGSEADEVLFHELVHGLRYMAAASVPEKQVGRYGDLEELIAVILANIYMAEKGQRSLRASHSDFSPMQHPREFLKNPQFRRLLLDFSNAQSDFYDEIADIPEDKAWWNPIRELRDEGA